MAARRAVLIWGGLVTSIAVPVTVATMSPYLAWRDPIYISAGFAGIAALAVLLVQPLLVGGYLPGIAGRRGRLLHRWTGTVLVGLILAHVGGLWVTSAPDVIDALLFQSPTAFSPWGVVAMWAAYGAAALAALRGEFRVPPAIWCIGHTLLVVVVVVGSVVHALLVEGTMGVLSKIMFCVLVLTATAKVIMDLRVWTVALRRRS